MSPPTEGRVLDGIQATDKAAGARGRSGEGWRTTRERKARRNSRLTISRLPRSRRPRTRSRRQYAPPPADPADEIEHLAQLHESGVLTDEEFAAAKAKVLGT